MQSVVLARRAERIEDPMQVLVDVAAGVRLAGTRGRAGGLDCASAMSTGFSVIF